MREFLDSFGDLQRRAKTQRQRLIAKNFNVKDQEAQQLVAAKAKADWTSLDALVMTNIAMFLFSFDMVAPPGLEGGLTWGTLVVFSVLVSRVSSGVKECIWFGEKMEWNSYSYVRAARFFPFLMPEDLLKLTRYRLYCHLRTQGYEHEQALNVTASWFHVMNLFQLPSQCLEHEVPAEAIVLALVQSDGNVTAACERVAEKAMVRRVFNLGLKVALFEMISRGQLAYAELVVQIDTLPVNKYEKLGRFIVTKTIEGIYTLLGALWSAVLAVIPVFQMYFDLPEELQALIELTGAVVLLILFIRYLLKRRSMEVTLVEKKQDNTTKFVGTDITQAGVVYKFTVDGVLHHCLAEESGVARHEEEMSMPGSDYYPSKKRAVAAVLVSTDSSDLQQIALAWRLNGCLVTARHVANGLSAGTANIYIAPIRSNGKNFEIDRKKIWCAPEGFFDLDENIVTDQALDVYMKQLSAAQWSQIGLAEVSTKLVSLYKQHICAVGFGDKGLLVTSVGTTQPGSGAKELWHTASTRKGFSGGPLFCGNSVVGLHVAGSSDKNIAIRIEVLKDVVRATCESNTSEEETYGRDWKFHGRSAKFEELDDGRFAVLTDDGGCSYGWTRRQITERWIGAFDVDEKEEDRKQDAILAQCFHNYNDESADLDKGKDLGFCWQLPSEKQGCGPTNPKPNPAIVQYLEEKMPELEKLGYQPGIFEYPDMSAESEERSVLNHLKLFDERAAMVKEPPTEKEMFRLVALVSKQLEANKFEPDSGYKTVEGLQRIINSSLIKPGKSSGYPHCTNGLPTNQQVIAAMGDAGLAQTTLNEWNESFDLKAFNKSEPTKKSKLAQGMPRIIVGLPLHKLLKHASVFKNLAFSMTDNWKKSPVKYAFAHGNAGHIENLAQWLGRGKLQESDKKNWDYMFQEWCFVACRKIVQELAVRPLNMPEEEFAQYLVDVEAAFAEICVNSRYRTSSGHVYSPKANGIMKSGWFLTIVVNSMAQITLNTLVLMRLGCTDEEILDKHKIVAGGDDVLQTLDGIDLVEYAKIAARLGMPIEEFVERESFAKCEFFSHEIMLDELTGSWKFLPVRFSKHIENLKKVKTEDLPQALRSAMGNWRWGRKEFDFFENMYKSFRLKEPAVFPLSNLETRQRWINRQLGYEVMEW